MLVAAVVTLFLAGLACRAVIFFRPHLEGDERIYRALVENLDAGRGYTLQGHPILEEPIIVKETYGRPLFFHPPGGLGLFWVLHRLFGDAGFPLAQLISYAIFFWSLMLLASATVSPFTPLAALLTASLAAFSPIMTHVVSRFWLDGPLLAFTTAAAAVFVAGHHRGRTSWACFAGGLLGYACLIKPTALIVLPGIVALAAAVERGAQDRRLAGTRTPEPKQAAGDARLVDQRASDCPPALGSRAELDNESSGDRHPGREGRWRDRRALALRAACLIGIAACMLLPWEIYQWTVIGNPLAVSPGRPAARLLAINRYVYYVTVVRSPWIYLSFLPRVIWTLAPSILLFLFQWGRPAVRRAGLALAVWIAAPIAVQVALGYAGYSKLLRYVVLITPAAVLLFVLVTSTAWENLRAVSRRDSGTSPAPLTAGRVWTWALLVAAFAGLVLEIAQGIKTPLLDTADLILSLG